MLLHRQLTAPDFTEVPSRLRKRLNFVFVDSMDQVLPAGALGAEGPEAIAARLRD
jgi:ATP-dependent Lon protease